MINHSYDGIREYDNPLPGWWSALFWVTIVFAAGYGIAVHALGWGAAPEDKYRAALVGYEDQRVAREQSEAASIDEAALARHAADPQTLADGQAVFAARCASCHADDGRGLIGPNLTDDAWIHGKGTLVDIYGTVNAGVLDKGMPAWGRQLSPSELRTVVAFVGTVRGTHVPGKAAEGTSSAPQAE